MKKIGITSRIVNAENYYEPRDCLARDWSFFLEKFLDKKDAWQPLPNIGSKIAEHSKKWGLNSFVFSGGENIGENEIRDKTEKKLFDFAIKNKFPVLGVCRGAQFINHCMGGKLIKCDSKIHVAKDHLVEIKENPFVDVENEIIVNSFHNFAIKENDLGQNLIPMAVSEEGFVEGFFSEDLPLLGLLWHPERENKSADFDLKLISSFFNKWI